MEKRGRSNLWECFECIKDKNGIELIIIIVACQICKNIHKYNKNSMSNLNKHKCYDLTKNKKGNALIEPTPTN